MVVFLIFLSFFITSCTKTMSHLNNQPEELVLSGIVKEDMILQGKIIIEKDLLIKKGVTVTIKEGSVVYIQSADVSRTEPVFLMPETEIVVEGSLNIDGSPTNPVIFKSSEKNEYWGGIIINGGRLSGRYFHISYAYNGLAILSGDAEIKNISLTDNRIGIVSDSGKTNIEDLLAVSNEVGMINNNLRLSIAHSRFEKNEEAIIFKNCPEKILNLSVTTNHYGIITNQSCINHNFLNLISYENKNNLIVTNLPSIP